jgi:hypothetical protein
MSDRKGQVIPTQTVQAYLVQPTDDGRQMALVLRTGQGAVGYALSHADFARFAARVLEVAAEKSSSPDSSDSVPVVALSVEEVSFETDPANSSVVTMASRLGGLRLALSLDSNALLRSFKQFLDARSKFRATRQ